MDSEEWTPMTSSKCSSLVVAEWVAWVVECLEEEVTDIAMDTVDKASHSDMHDANK